MLALVQYLPFLGLLALANYAELNRTARVLTYLALALLDAMLFLGGVLALMGHAVVRQPGFVESLPLNLAELYLLQVDFFRSGAMLLAMAVLASAVLWFPVRKLLARWLPFDPDSCLDCVALALTVYYIGFTALQLTLLGGPEGLAEMSLTPTVGDILQGGLFLIVFAMVGVGWGIRRNLHACLERLKVEWMTRKQWLVALGLVLVFLAFDQAVSVLWELLDPVGYQTISEAMKRLFGDLSAPAVALLLALSAGVGEELLFRGALQPRFGIWFTSLAFTLGHLQYGFSPALAEVFIISVILGFVRQKTNTSTCVAIHAIYNLADLILMSLRG